MYLPTSPSRQRSEEKLNSSNFSTDIRLVSRLTNIAFEVERGRERWGKGGRRERGEKRGRGNKGRGDTKLGWQEEFGLKHGERPQGAAPPL
jgi:hypothetical protein